MLRFIRPTVAVVSILCLAAVVAGRQTDDIGHDAVAALLASEQFEDAEWLCNFQRDRAGSDALRYAKWSARLAEVIGRREANQLFVVKPAELSDRMDVAIEQACRPLDSLIRESSDSQYEPFLQAVRLAVRRQQLRAAIVITTVSPVPPEMIDDLLSRISRLQSDSATLQERARRLWSARQAARISSRRDADPLLMAGEYERLIGELAVQRVSLALLQTELFRPDSDDYHAAASEAVRVAGEVLPSLADDTAAKWAVKASMAEALLRAGEVAQAGRLVREAAGANSEAGVDTAVWTALAAKHQLALGDTDAAQAICDAYFAAAERDRQQAGAGLAVDFAQLQILLTGPAGQPRLTAWLDAIGQRGGAFARRRAEAVVIEALRGGGTANQDRSAIPAASPGLIAAQGEDALRRSEPRRAAGLLRQAAVAESDAPKAFAYATKSAAAAIAAGDPTAAADVLIEIARKHVGEESAPELVMQAAILISRSLDAAPAAEANERVRQLERVLAELAQTWPQTRTAFQANRWRCRILLARDQLREAADASLQFIRLRKQADQIEPLAELWFDYVSQSADDAAGGPLDKLSDSLRELTDEQPNLKPSVDRMAAWLFDPDALAGRTIETATDDATSTFLDAVLKFRRGERNSLTADGDLGETLLRRIRWRLERDAQLEPQRRSTIGSVLQSWPNATPWQRAVADFWVRPDRSSIDAIKRLATETEDASAAMSRTIKVLAASDSPLALKAAVEFSDRAAATHAIGTDRWYEEKLRAIQLLVRSGNRDEAVKRANYVLLVRPPQDASLRERFEAAIRQASRG